MSMSPSRLAAMQVAKSEQTKRDEHRMYQAATNAQKWGRGAMPPLKEVGAPTTFGGKVDYEYLQCAYNGRIPGYTGFMPTKYSQSQYGQPAADVHGRSGTLCQTKPTRAASAAYVAPTLKTKPEEHFNKPAEWTKSYSSKEKFGLDKPAMTTVMANYSVPRIPGYSGYVPGKKVENVAGGGVTFVAGECKKIFTERGEKEAQGMYTRDPPLGATMNAYYEWQEKSRYADDSWKDPNFLKRVYCDKGYRNDSRISVAGKSFNTKYGHKMELAPFDHLNQR
ncbi:unnamed protein product [Amoebophrya sp. A25]|nr:unnamed protein product [Amoebophrya sp. A25]|eukprot:GSA25T00018600001.1